MLTGILVRISRASKNSQNQETLLDFETVERRQLYRVFNALIRCLTHGTITRATVGPMIVGSSARYSFLVRLWASDTPTWDSQSRPGKMFC